MKIQFSIAMFLFSSAGLCAQTNTFPASGNAGIGTTSPVAKLDVVAGTGTTDIRGVGPNAYILVGNVGSGESYYQANAGHHFQGLSGNETVTILGNGKVGIGTSNPQALFDVGGMVQISGQNLATPPTDLSYGLFPYGGVGLGIFSGATDAAQGIGIWTNPSGVRTEVIRILSGGNIGIGTISPAEKLSVNGKIRAKEIKVENTNWPDFVFSNSYALPTLRDIEKHIKEKGHLSGIPSASEVKNKGVDLGEMNAKLLEKIEELTLHLIELSKKNEQQAIDIAELKSRINK